MTDDAAKELAAAMRELAASIRAVSAPASVGNGIHVYYHVNSPVQQLSPYPGLTPQPLPMPPFITT